MLFIGFRVVLAAIALAVLANAATQPTKVGLGGNLDWFCGTCDYYGAAVFVNALKQSRTFGYFGQAWVTDGWSYNSIGLPIGQQKFSTFLFDVQRPIADTAGAWTVRITGADVTVSANSMFRCCSAIRNLSYNATTKVTTGKFDCPATCTNIDMDFQIKDMSQTITNMEVIRPGYPIDNYPMFTNSYIAFVKGLNTLRFMDWAQTNGQRLTEWSQRSTLNSLQWTTSQGIPWEAAIELANTVGSNVWVNIPSNATDDYMLQMAKLFRANLDPNLIVYLEFSNEPWNSGFQVTQDSFRIGPALYATGNYDFLDFDKSGNIWYMGYRWTVWRAYIASNIWRTVYGDAAMMTIVRPVIDHQYVYTIWATVGLQMIDAVFGPPAKFFFGIAGAPYFGMRDSSKDSTVDDVWQQMDYGSQDILNSLADNFYIAKRYGLEVLCYEGGAEIPGGGNTAVKKLVNFDPRMEGTIVRYLQALWSSGVRLFNYYFVGVNEFGGANDWGVVDSVFNTSQPKYKALKTAVALNKADSDYAYVPAPRTDVITSPVWSFIPQSEQGWPTSWDLSRWKDWTHMLGEPSVNGANYDLQFDYTASSPISMTVLINNKVVCNVTIPVSATRVNFTACSFTTVPKVNVFFMKVQNTQPVSGNIFYARFLKKSNASAYKWTPMSYPPTSATVCGGPVAEGATLSLRCPDGQVVTSVPFASYGTPSGSCTAGFKTSSCNSARSLSVVQAACLGKNSCSVGASNGGFDDPCEGTVKQLAIQVYCSTPTSLCSTAAEGQAASVYCPKNQKIASVDFASYGTPSGSCGKFVAGCTASTSLSYAQGQCLGKSSCSISASNNVFGDPCPGIVKQFALQVTCM